MRIHESLTQSDVVLSESPGFILLTLLFSKLLLEHIHWEKPQNCTELTLTDAEGLAVVSGHMFDYCFVHETYKLQLTLRRDVSSN